MDAAAFGPMSVLESLEQSGEVLSPNVRAAILALEARVRQLEALEPLVEQLQAKIRELEARLGTNSRNSSKPPSSDPAYTKPAREEKNGKRGTRGAQSGHKGAGRELLSEARVDEVLEYRPECCPRCGYSLADAPTGGEPAR